MKTSQLIAELQRSIEEYGDLDVFTANHYSLDTLMIQFREDFDFPADWNMPTMFLTINPDDV